MPDRYVALKCINVILMKYITHHTGPTHRNERSTVSRGNPRPLNAPMLERKQRSIRCMRSRAVGLFGRDTNYSTFFMQCIIEDFHYTKCSTYQRSGIFKRGLLALRRSFLCLRERDSGRCAPYIRSASARSELLRAATRFTNPILLRKIPGVRYLSKPI